LARSVACRRPHQRLQLCGERKLRFALNIMFLTACKYSIFLASVAATFKNPCGFLAAQLPLHSAHGYLSLT